MDLSVCVCVCFPLGGRLMSQVVFVRQAFGFLCPFQAPHSHLKKRHSQLASVCVLNMATAASIP